MLKEKLKKQINKICPECFKELTNKQAKLKSDITYCIRCYSQLIQEYSTIDFKNEDMFSIQAKLPVEFQLTEDNKQELKKDFQRIKKLRKKWR